MKPLIFIRNIEFRDRFKQIFRIGVIMFLEKWTYRRMFKDFPAYITMILSAISATIPILWVIKNYGGIRFSLIFALR